MVAVKKEIYPGDSSLRTNLLKTNTRMAGLFQNRYTIFKKFFHPLEMSFTSMRKNSWSDLSLYQFVHPLIPFPT